MMYHQAHKTPCDQAAGRGGDGRRSQSSGILLALAIGLLLSFPGLVQAAGSLFPRGQGFYFSIPKLASLLVIYLCWVATCRWIDQDVADLRLSSLLWNPLLFACGAIGLFVVWLLPWFWLAFLLLVILYATPSLAYVNLRNQLVRPEQRVLTKRHLKELGFRYLKLRFRARGDDEADGAPVEFIGKGGRDDEGSASVARAVGSKGFKAAKEMVYEAIQKRATDIHLEPTKEEMSVRFRIDGILHSADPFSRQMGDAVVNIFKVLATLDITEKRKPQDGSLSALVEGRPIDFRVATAGSVVGEKMVMRILDKSQHIINLTQLGMRDKLRDQVHTIAGQPHGMLIVCGPTGAGKSTTLYACLNEIDRYQKNVITIENPVEYNIENVTQIEVNPKAGKTFASELRSILRQDPDVIYIGEIRDQETAEISCQAAQTGHMVFTTLHANDTVTALGRLIDLGVQPFMIADAVSAILGQRLVRLLCPKCKVRYKPNPDLLRKANLPADKIKHFYRPPESPGEGGRREDDDEDLPGVCAYCGGTGYYGRTGIFELLLITDRIREMIRDNPNLNAIRQEAIKTGMKYLQEDGLRQVIEGKTSIQELLRVSK
ncbi:MAG TPA: GspE/PulE family protein [Gemmataceae bacterium]|nr:GspE/PulE family protein [Gemmataceae bacterium]